MTASQGSLLVGASLAAGVINSVAGGGSFFTFPALVFTGMPSIAANATNTVALWPGAVASVGAYRQDIRRERRHLPWLVGISLAGGLFGALILIETPQATFDRLVPWLLLGATLVFFSGGKITSWLRGVEEAKGRPARIGFLSAAIQFVIATYGGYFGGGAGMLMLAMLSLSGLTDIHAMNGIKTLLNAALNFVAIATFAAAGLVHWPQAFLMMAGAVAGGYGGAYLARRTDPRLIRGFVIAVGLAMSAYFFARSY